jgi:zinc/manganese transport system substrate-binding protein
MKKLVALIGLVLLIGATPGMAADKLRLVASFSILGDMVSRIAGDHAEVLTLVGPDGDAHTFEPSPADAKEVASAKVVFVNGLGLDKWIESLAHSAEYQGPVITVSSGIKTRTMMEDNETITDPHAWQDLRNGAIYAANIAAALIAADPPNAADYGKNRDAYVAELAALDDGVRQQFASVPAAKRRVITSHDAFGYFGAAYGIEFLAPEGLSTEAEASAGDLSKLMTQIKSEGIKALFIENITDPRMMTMIANETGVELGGALFSDALSPPDGPAPTYIAMFKNNVPKLLEGMAKN